MRVILLQDVKNVGKKDDVVEVSEGYGVNFLIRRGLAVMFTAHSKAILNKQKEVILYSLAIEDEDKKRWKRKINKFI